MKGSKKSCGGRERSIGCITVVGAKGMIGNAEEFLHGIRELEKRFAVSIQVISAIMVFGKLHLEIAARHAVRAWAEGRATANSISGEILLYASAERQIHKAVQKVGVKDGDRETALVILGDCDVREILRALGLKRDDKVLEPEGKSLESFGISSAELESVPAEKKVDLVLEKMAVLDIEK